MLFAFSAKLPHHKGCSGLVCTVNGSRPASIHHSSTRDVMNYKQEVTCSKVSSGSRTRRSDLHPRFHNSRAAEFTVNFRDSASFCLQAAPEGWRRLFWQGGETTGQRLSGRLMRSRGCWEEMESCGFSWCLLLQNNAASGYMLAQIFSKDNAGHVFNVVWPDVQKCCSYFYYFFIVQTF